MSTNEIQSQSNSTAEILRRHGFTDEREIELLVTELKGARREWRKMQGHFTQAQLVKFEASFSDEEKAEIQLKVANPTR